MAQDWPKTFDPCGHKLDYVDGLCASCYYDDQRELRKLRTENEHLRASLRAATEPRFRGGPLGAGHATPIHSLVAYMAGDGRHALGAYVRIYEGGTPTNTFEWRLSEDVW